jgi:hypothetical protein
MNAIAGGGFKLKKAEDRKLADTPVASPKKGPGTY